MNDTNDETKIGSVSQKRRARLPATRWRRPAARVVLALPAPRILLLLILGLAFGLRIFFINRSPPALYWEEAALGYDAWSILKTGKDYHGHFLPVVAFESFGDYKPPGYFYALVPVLAVFGPQDWAVRLPSVLAGTVTVYLVYLIAVQIGKRQDWGLWSALTLAITPWHVQFSRGAFEVNLATMLLTLGVYWLLLARVKIRYLMAAVLPIGLSMYTYHSLRVLAPLMTLLLLGAGFRTFYKQRKYLAASLGLALLMVWPLIRAWQTPQLKQRFAETSVFSTSKAISVSNEARAADGMTLVSRFRHHRYWYWGGEIMAGMVSHLNPDFLFIQGDGNPRHQTGMAALFYPWMLIPLMWGLIRLTDVKNRQGWWLIGWIVLAMIPPALTNLTPHTLRFLPAVPAFAIIMGLGMEALSAKIQKIGMANWIYGLMASLIAGSVVLYVYDLWWVYPKRTSQYWQYGYREALGTIKAEFDRGKSIYFTRTYGRPSIYTLWYFQIPPKEVQSQSGIPQDKGELLRINNIQFEKFSADESDLIVSEADDLPYPMVKTINFLDGKSAFYVYQIK